MLIAGCGGEPTTATPADTPDAPQQATVASIRITPSTRALLVGDKATLTAVALDPGGGPIADLPFAWTSEDGAIATVDGFGEVTARAPGAVDISATSQGVKGTASIVVTDASIPASLAMPAMAFVAAKAMSRLDVQVTNAVGETIDEANLVWTSSDSMVVQVDHDGKLHGRALGTVSLTASSGGLSATASVTVLGREPAIHTGDGHSCGIATDGTAYCWGYNHRGQLGVGDTGDVFVPIPVQTPVTLTGLTTGMWHTCGLSADGTAYCWGMNEHGQLGDGTLGERWLPAAVATNIRFRQLAAGGWHTCGLALDGTSHCWGRNDRGQLGDGSTAERLSPVSVVGALVFEHLDAGVHSHSCGLTADGAAYCWGANEFGQLGDGSNLDRAVPGPVVGNQVFVSVSAGDFHSCGLTNTSRAYCWGRNETGQLGNGTTESRSAPDSVHEDDLMVSVAAGSEATDSGWGAHTCGVAVSGEICCWGATTFGQLGRLDLGRPFHPVSVGVDSDLIFASVDAGGLYNCSHTSGGEAFCWGWGYWGQLGNGGGVRDPEAHEPLPNPVAGGLRFSPQVMTGAASSGNN
jgi:alpha-tubulin suppressor-like RCC1 family protein